MEQPLHPLEEGKVFLVDKPLGWTSFNVVSRVRNWAHREVGHKVKTGHAGTLDPLATGLLIICTGRFTKKIDEYQAKEKEYTGTFVLGAVTKSFDLETAPEPAGDYTRLTEADLRSAAGRFIGNIRQIPPVFSAIKVQGKRAYEYARSEKELQLEPKNIEIKEFELTRIALPEVDFRVVCSKGTYIRSLARDYGQALGCGAYLSALRRTRIGPFKIEDAKNVSDFATLPRSDNQPSKYCQDILPYQR